MLGRSGRWCLRKKWTVVLAVLSFIIPLAAWSVVSYVPFVYHPLVKVVDAGGSMFCQPGDEIERANFEEENKTLLAAGEKMMTGVRINPAYLPAPHKVAKALVTAFMTEPRRDGDVWFYESILHSVKIVFLAFLLSRPSCCRVSSACRWALFAAQSRSLKS